jgi:hypothetical protein
MAQPVDQRDAIQRIAELAALPPAPVQPTVQPLFRPFRFGPSWCYLLSGSTGPVGPVWCIDVGRSTHQAGSLAAVLEMVGHRFTCSDRCLYRLTDARDRGKELPAPADLSTCACCGRSLRRSRSEP